MEDLNGHSSLSGFEDSLSISKSNSIESQEASKSKIQNVLDRRLSAVSNLEYELSRKTSYEDPVPVPESSIDSSSDLRMQANSNEMNRSIGGTVGRNLFSKLFRRKSRQNLDANETPLSAIQRPVSFTPSVNTEPSTPYIDSLPRKANEFRPISPSISKVSNHMEQSPQKLISMPLFPKNSKSEGNIFPLPIQSTSIIGSDGFSEKERVRKLVEIIKKFRNPPLSAKDDDDVEVKFETIHRASSEILEDEINRGIRLLEISTIRYPVNHKQSHSPQSANDSETESPYIAATANQLFDDYLESHPIIAPALAKVSNSVESRSPHFAPSYVSNAMKHTRKFSETKSIVFSKSIKPLYLSLEPHVVAGLIFHRKLDVIPYERIGEILGKPDEQHRALLKHYVDLFDLRGDLDDALRKFCSIVKLSGETQTIDRVLFAFTKRYWVCNPNLHAKFVNLDVVYVIVFSLILLNTDLHFVQTVYNHRKMTKKEYVKNTLESLDKTLTGRKASLPAMATTSFGSEPRNNSMSSAIKETKTPKKDLENLLKNLYDSIKESMLEIPKPESPTSVINLNRSSTADSIGGNKDMERVRSSTHKNSLAETPKTLNSNDGDFSNQTTGFQSLGEGNTSKDHSRSQSLFVDTSNGPLSERKYSVHNGGTGQSSVSSQNHAAALKYVNRRFSTGSSENNSGLSTTGKSSSLERQPILHGVVRKKHLFDEHTVKAKNRRWVDTFVMFYADNIGIDLSMSKGAGDLYTSNLPPNQRNRLSNPTASSMIANSSDVMQNSFKGFGNDPVQIVTLSHAIAHPLPEQGYSKDRPHVFHLLLNNGTSYLFECASVEDVQEWCRLINYWAARKSREPMRGGSHGSEDYGWGFILRHRDTNNDEVERALAQYMKKLKLEEWTPPYVGPLLSNNSIIVQLTMIRRQIELINTEIQEHESIHEAINLLYQEGSGLKNKALENWEKKYEYLIRELGKYMIYDEVLSPDAEPRSGTNSGVIIKSLNSPSINSSLMSLLSSRSRLLHNGSNDPLDGSNDLIPMQKMSSIKLSSSFTGLSSSSFSLFQNRRGGSPSKSRSVASISKLE